ncbi:MAG: hypothetical protein MR000_11635 [Cloacibacillus porcorum]|uniref:hypothetical protein n=1 Tax=Cloacibacillus porcorum TaxID=1197717 RepID=UPI00235233DD|nr:hypothetical protein [Cloacibacillus porcorum]MCI5865867.1 hypothetical protein [Cloacibacillus porcorum]
MVNIRIPAFFFSQYSLRIISATARASKSCALSSRWTKSTPLAVTIRAASRNRHALSSASSANLSASSRLTWY